MAAGFLDRQELAGVGVVFHVGIGFDDQRIADDETEPPAGHVETFAHRVQFDADIHRAGRGEERERLAFEYQRGIGGVVDDDQIVLLGEGDDLRRRIRCGRLRRSDCSDN